MSTWVNSIKNMIQRDPKYSVRGPVLQSIQFIDRYQQQMYVLNMEVAAGTKVDPAFGYFFETRNEGNTNKSRLIIYLAADVDEEGKPVYATRCSEVKDVNEYICRASVCKTLVPKGATKPTGNDIWDVEVAYFDEVHDEMTVTRVLEFSTVETTEWDEALNRENDVVMYLSKTKPSSGLIVEISPARTFYRTSRKIKCGWYVVKEETLDPEHVYSYETVENYYWPNVLKRTPTGLPFPNDYYYIDLGIVEGKGKDEDDEEFFFIAGVVPDYRMKRAYSGPCKVEVEISWSPIVPLNWTDGVQQLIPEGLSYAGIFFNISLPECLRPSVSFYEATGSNNPKLRNQVRSKGYPATEMMEIGGECVVTIDWPESIIGEKPVKPYKGGFLLIQKRFYSPTCE